MDIRTATQLASFTLQFARVDRATFHPDGKRPETDSDHTVMLATISCEFCPSYLNRGRVAEFAIAHDMVEGVEGVGDVQTLDIDAAGRAAKEERERAGVEWLRERFGAGSWLVRTIDAYVAQVEPEARFVRALDKVVPRLTHALNGGAAAKKITGGDFEKFKRLQSEHYQKLQEEFGGEPWGPDFLTLLNTAILQAELAWVRDDSANKQV